MEDEVEHETELAGSWLAGERSRDGFYLLGGDQREGKNELVGSDKQASWIAHTDRQTDTRTHTGQKTAATIWYRVV